MKRWLLFFLIPLALLVGLIAWRISQKRAEAAEQVQIRQARSRSAPLVAVVPATRRDIVRAFEGVGSVEAPLSVRVAPRVTGRIDALTVDAGDPVTRGQVLARIDPAEVEAEVRQQQAAVAQARSRLAEAQMGQSPANVAVGTEIRRQAAALSTARADLEQARRNDEAQQATALSAVADAQSRIENAAAQIAGAEAAIRSAESNLANARVKQERAERLFQEGAVAAEVRDNARTEVRQLEGALAEARERRNAAQTDRASAVIRKRTAERQVAVIRGRGKAEIAAASARVVQAQANLENARAGRAQRPAYQQHLAALRAAVDSAEAALRAAQARRSDTVLTAPLTGVVTERLLDPGAMASPSQPVLAVQAIRQVWVNVPVPEETGRRIYTGQRATVTLDALPGRNFAGRITRINPAADPQSRQFPVRVRVDNRENQIKPGMFARVRVETDRFPGSIVVPREAIRKSEEGGGASVIVVDAQDVARLRPVETGASESDVVAITDGLKAGEKVVVLGGDRLKDGQKVRTGPPGGGRQRPGQTAERTPGA